MAALSTPPPTATSTATQPGLTLIRNASTEKASAVTTTLPALRQSTSRRHHRPVIANGTTSAVTNAAMIDSSMSQE